MHANVFVQLCRTIINTQSKRKKVKLVFRPKKQQSKTGKKEYMMQLNISKVFWLTYVVITLVYDWSTKMLPKGHHRTEEQEDITQLLFNVGESINVCKVFF